MAAGRGIRTVTRPRGRQGELCAPIRPRATAGCRLVANEGVWPTLAYWGRFSKLSSFKADNALHSVHKREISL